MADAQYIFDAQHSLTGSCLTDEVDAVADPSCPYNAFPAGTSGPFVRPSGMAIDTYGNLYIVVRGVEPSPDAHVDIFGPDSKFIAEVTVLPGVSAIAVDGDGHMYLYGGRSATDDRLVRYDPDPGSYSPANGQITYETTPTGIPLTQPTETASLAVNPLNNHLFVEFLSYANSIDGANELLRTAIVELGSAEEGNPILDDKAAEVDPYSSTVGTLAIDAARGRLYAVDKVKDPLGEGARLIRVFELGAPHNLIETLDGSSMPEGTFVKCGFVPENCIRSISIAVDEGTGNLFVYDRERQDLIYRLNGEGQYLATIRGTLSTGGGSQLAVDNGAESPNGAQRSEGRYLWVDPYPKGIGHAFAFVPLAQCPPVVESTSVSHVGEGEALLRAEVEPCQLETTYSFEYVSAQQFAESEFEGAKVAGEGVTSAGGEPVAVSAGATGLVAGTEYVFRVVAKNELGEDAGQGTFRTYPAPDAAGSCPNQSLRTGLSGLLPDCRAYELVTPPNTNGLVPWGSGFLGDPLFISRTASLSGGSVFFRIEGGALPGSEGTGSLFGYPYFATRGAQGWTTADGAGRSNEYRDVEVGGRSPDLGYSTWRGLADNAGTIYLRFPDGHSQPLGQGTLATEPNAGPYWISEEGRHVVFFSTSALEPGAPTGSIYDRTSDGTLHVASLLPGDLPAPNGTVVYRGASPDGLGIAFTVDQLGPGEHRKLYLRYDNDETYEVGEDVTYEGIAEGGRRIFYLDGGKLYAFDIDQGKIPFAGSTDTTVVNVARDGTAAYFVSASKLTSVANPLGQKAKIGLENLYLSREGQISFVATLTGRDVAGTSDGEGGLPRDGLGLWSSDVKVIGGLPTVPARSSADGSVLLFASRAGISGYENAGHPELYRFDSNAVGLSCVSCNPTGTPAVADAILQPLPKGQTDTGPTRNFPTWIYDRIENLSPDGRRAFFETAEPLVARDVDGLRDVYEWEAQGKGSCAEPEGCLYLISSGRSARDNFLYGVSQSGDDVFILTTDLLDPARDPDETASIYDARVDGGFALASPPAECLGEACQPIAHPPERPAQVLQGAGNVPKRPCPKGKGAVRKNGKVRCVRPHKKRSSRHKRHGRNNQGNAKRGRSHR